MIIRMRLGQWKFTFTMAPVQDVIGVNSQVGDNKHILMWDFDDQPLDMVEASLLHVQHRYFLSNIYILLSSPPSNYFAYCFQSYPWWLARSIIGATIGIDENFYKWGIFRKRFTLRVSPKDGNKPKLVSILKSNANEDIDVKQLSSWVQYETLVRHNHGNIYHVGKR
jgi:hypothetical protein